MGLKPLSLATPNQPLNLFFLKRMLQSTCSAIPHHFYTLPFSIFLDTYLAISRSLFSMGPFVHHLLRLNLPVYSYNTCVAPTPSNLHLPQSHLLTLLIIANAGNMPRNTPLLVYLVYILACTKPKSGTQIFCHKWCCLPFHPRPFWPLLQQMAQRHGCHASQGLW